MDFLVDFSFFCRPWWYKSWGNPIFGIGYQRALPRVCFQGGWLLVQFGLPWRSISFSDPPGSNGRKVAECPSGGGVRLIDEWELFHMAMQKGIFNACLEPAIEEVRKPVLDAVYKAMIISWRNMLTHLFKPFLLVQRGIRYHQFVMQVLKFFLLLIKARCQLHLCLKRGRYHEVESSWCWHLRKVLQGEPREIQCSNIPI